MEHVRIHYPQIISTWFTYWKSYKESSRTSYAGSTKTTTTTLNWLPATVFAEAMGKEMTQKDWEDQVKSFRKYEAVMLLAKGGMGAALRVTSRRDFSDRALKLALGEREEYLEEEGGHPKSSKPWMTIFLG